MHENAKEFYLEGNKIGCLLIHGFTGTPAEMKLLGLYLNEKGYTVNGVLLRGHGTTVEDMEKTNWKDWMLSAESGLIELKKKCEKVAVIGLSMGGIIALNLASKHSIDYVVSISSPIKITNKQAYWAPVMKFFKKYAIRENKKINPEIEDYALIYDKTPIVSVSHLLSLITRTKLRLRKIKAPLLIIQSKKDNTVIHESAQYIYDHTGSNIKKLVYLKESGHVATIDCEKEKVFREIWEFINQ